MSVIYKPGKDMLVADCLSRAQLSEISEIEGLSGVIHSVTKAVCLTQENYDFYRSVLESDSEYLRIRGYVENRWPRFHQLDPLSQQFYKLKSELHVENGLLFVNHRLVIPSGMQRRLLNWLHSSHLGIEKTLARARKLYYWPGMNRDIRAVVSSCRICEKFKRNQQKEPLVQEDLPRYPFHIVGMDIFEYAGRDYVALYDAYSNYILSSRIQNKTSGHVIKTISQIFNIIGYPTIIKCDNSPFSSGEFKRFADEYNVQFKFSSPGYPQSNGLAEKGVAIAKNIVKRCVEMNEADRFQYHLLDYNTTPVADMHVAPTELFFGRLLKTKLPISDSLLIRNRIEEPEVSNRLYRKKERQRYYYNKNAKSLPVLKEGDLIMFKKQGKDWNYGQIVSSFNGRSYLIKDSFNNYFRRNRRFIAKTRNNDFSASDLAFEEDCRGEGSHIDAEPKETLSPVSKRHDLNDKLADRTSSPDQGNSGANESLPSVNVEPPMRITMDEIIPEDSDSNVPEPKTLQPDSVHTRVTRSGRVIKPPSRYGRD